MHIFHKSKTYRCNLILLMKLLLNLRKSITLKSETLDAQHFPFAWGFCHRNSTLFWFGYGYFFAVIIHALQFAPTFELLSCYRILGWHMLWEVNLALRGSGYLRALLMYMYCKCIGASMCVSGFRQTSSVDHCWRTTSMKLSTYLCPKQSCACIPNFT